jgi:hypothetical protein
LGLNLSEGFEAAYWADYGAVKTRLEQLFRSDRAAFEAAWARAQSLFEPKRLVAGAEVLSEAGELDPWRALAAAAGLLALGRPRQALDLLSHPEIVGSSKPKFALYRARALAAVGDFAAAQEAAAASGGPLRDRIAEVLGLEQRLEQAADWQGVRRLISLYLELSAIGPAQALFLKAVGLAPAIRKPEYVDMRLALELGLDLGVGAEQAAALIDETLVLAPSNVELRALRYAFTLEPNPPDKRRTKPRPTDHHAHWRYYQAIGDHRSGRFQEAVKGLGRIADENRRNPEIRGRLGLSVGACVLAASPKPGRAQRPPRIVNVLPFSDELDLLELRLAEMADWVDAFVICEASATFAGAPKPLHFKENAERFAPWRDKIVHVAVDFPEFLHGHWARDFYQRDMAIGALAGLCAEQDLVIISDADEIVDRRAIEGFDGDFAVLRMPLNRFFVNYRSRLEPGERAPPAGAIWRASYLARFGISHARFALSRRGADWPGIDQAGWHFSSLGKAAQISGKHRNYAHQEGGSVLHSESEVERLLLDLQEGRLEPGWTRTEIDDSFPGYLRQQPERFSSYILKPPVSAR